MSRLTIFRKIRSYKDYCEDYELVFSRTNKEDQREILCKSNLPNLIMIFYGRQIFLNCEYGRKLAGLIDGICMEGNQLA